jgi:hypothetical protein
LPSIQRQRGRSISAAAFLLKVSGEAQIAGPLSGEETALANVSTAKAPGEML